MPHRGVGRRILPSTPLARAAPILGCLLIASGQAAAAPPRGVYVTSEGSGVVAAVDAASLKVVRRIEVGGRPHNLEVAAGGLLLVATQGATSVSVIDPATDPPTVKRIAIGAPPHDIAVGPDGRTAFVISERGLLLEIDFASGRVVREVRIGGKPHNLIAWRQTVWITDISAGRMFVLDGAELAELPISVAGHDLAVRPASEELWVTPWSGDRVIVLDLSERKEIATVRVGRAASHKHIAFGEDGGEAWISEPESESLFVVSAEARTPLARLDAGGHPHHLRVASGRAYVAVGPRDLVVFDIKTRAIVGRVTAGSGVHDVGLLPRE